MNECNYCSVLNWAVDSFNTALRESLLHLNITTSDLKLKHLFLQSQRRFILISQCETLVKIGSIDSLY